MTSFLCPVCLHPADNHYEDFGCMTKINKQDSELEYCTCDIMPKEIYLEIALNYEAILNSIANESPAKYHDEFEMRLALQDMARRGLEPQNRSKP